MKLKEGLALIAAGAVVGGAGVLKLFSPTNREQDSPRYLGGYWSNPNEGWGLKEHEAKKYY